MGLSTILNQFFGSTNPKELLDRQIDIQKTKLNTLIRNLTLNLQQIADTGSKEIYKIHKRCMNDLFIKRSFAYIIISIIFIFISYQFSSRDIWPLNKEGLSSLISILIQSEATILAIIISVSLVAVQQVASSYSPRVTKIFMDKNRNPDFWILIIIYIFAMIYGLFILKQIDSPVFFSPIKLEGYEGTENIINTLLNLKTSIWFTLFLSFIALFSLYPYIKNILVLLEPSKLIDAIAEDISEQKIKEAIDSQKVRDYDDNDPIHSIVDIVRNSLINFDNQKAIKGFVTIEVRIKKILESENFGDQYFKIMSENLIDYLTNMGKLALKNDNESFVLRVLKNICRVAEQSVNKNIEVIALKSIDSIEQIGKIAVQRRMEYASAETLDCLKKIGKSALSLKMRRNPSSLWNKRKTKYIIQKVALSATEIEKEAIKSGMILIKREANNIITELYPRLAENSDNNHLNFLLLLTKSEEIYKELKFNKSNEPDKYDEALKYVNKALEIGCFDRRVSKRVEGDCFDIEALRDALVLKGEILSKRSKEKKELDEALVTYNNALSLCPDDVEILVLKGNLLCQFYKENDLDQVYTYAIEDAWEAYSRSLELNKNDIFIWYHKASFHFKIGEYKKSLEICEKIISLESDCTYASGLKELCIEALSGNNE